MKGYNGAPLFPVRAVKPSVMEHSFGQPFAGEILNQRIGKRDCGVGGHDRPMGPGVFETADERR